MKVIPAPEQTSRARLRSDIVLVNGFGIVSGVGPIDLENDRVALPEGVENQVRKIFANLDILLKSAGLSRAHVVAVRVYLVEAARLLDRMNAVYAGFFPSERLPARSVIGASYLTRGAQVEMEFVVCEKV